MYIYMYVYMCVNLLFIVIILREEFVSMVMERVASEYNKLQYNVSHSNNHPLIDEMTPRIANITSTLQNHLQDTFRSSLERKDRESLVQSLQTYASINRQSAAEEMFQNILVRPYVEQVSFLLKVIVPRAYKTGSTYYPSLHVHVMLTVWDYIVVI